MAPERREPVLGGFIAEFKTVLEASGLERAPWVGYRHAGPFAGRKKTTHQDDITFVSGGFGGYSAWTSDEVKAQVIESLPARDSLLSDEVLALAGPRLEGDTLGQDL